MARLSARERARLPDSSFAYVDGRGKRLLPIHDASHVRNALARFDQVAFESEEARRRARERLLNAARRHGIVPVGFINSQLRTDQRQAATSRVVIELARIGTSEELERQLRNALADPELRLLLWTRDGYVDTEGNPADLPSGDRRGPAVTLLEARGGPSAALVHARQALADPDIAEAVRAAVGFVVERERLERETASRPTDPSRLPTGFVTHLLTDIEGSTVLLADLQEQYAELLARVRRVIRAEVRKEGGHEVEVRADETFAVFEDAGAAVRAAVAFQRGLAEVRWPADAEVRVRAGIHSGEIAFAGGEYVGMSVNIASRVTDAAHGGQILVTAATRRAVGGTADDVAFRSVGAHQLPGVPQPVELFQADGAGLLTDFPPPRAKPAR